jgi:hypothetical protein
MAVASMIAVTMVWSAHGTVALTPDRSKLAAIAAYRPGWQTANFLDRLSIDLPAAVRLNRVPAGDYEIAPASGSVIAVGRNDAPIATGESGSDKLTLRLPVAMQTLNVRAGQASTLRPLAVHSPLASRNAVRAARYGTARVFFFDERAYLEPDGFWTRADGTAEVVIDSDDASRASGLPLSITAGAVPTMIELSVGSWRDSWSLTAGQRQEVVLPPSESGSWLLRIQSGAGFRPSERDPGSRDVRLLSAWIAIR